MLEEMEDMVCSAFTGADAEGVVRREYDLVLLVVVVVGSHRVGELDH